MDAGLKRNAQPQLPSVRVFALDIVKTPSDNKPQTEMETCKEKMSSYIAAFKQTVNHYIHICTYSIRDESSRHGIHTIFTYLLVLSVFDYHYNIASVCGFTNN